MSDDQTPQSPAVEDSFMPEETAPIEALQPQTFPADYVQELRQEAADYRTRSKSMATQLVQAWAAVDGRLLDPTDLPLSSVEVGEDGNISRDAVTAAIDALVKSKPHLAAQRPAPMPQGAQPESEPVSLLRILQNRP
jgi:hypothetical protein